MGFNGTQITEYKDGRDTVTGTRALGTTFNNEFGRLYENDNYLKDTVDDIQDQIDALIGGAPETLNTLNELSAALNDDEAFATNVLNKITAATGKNLVYNGEFELYSNRIVGASNWYDFKHPDGFLYSDDGSDGKVGHDSASECCKIVTSSDGTAMSFKQALHEFLRWGNKLKTKKVTGKVRIKGPNTITVKVFDGVNTVSQALTGSGSIEEIDLQITVNSAATGLWIEVSTTSNTQTIELYEVYFNVGETAVRGLPCQIPRIGFWQGQDEDYPDNVFEGDTTEIPAGYTRLESFLNGRFGTGSNGRSKLPEYQGRFLRVWANGSANDPDRATRADRGDGTGGDVSGSKQEDQNKLHTHGIERIASGALWPGGSGYAVYGASSDGSGGNQANPKNINTLAGIRWC